MRKPFDPWFTAPKYPINSFDIDGVIYMGDDYDGIYPGPKDFNDRKQSGQSKAKWFQHLKWLGYRINIHFDDDPIQIGEIKKECPDIECVHIHHHLVPKE